MPAGNSDTRGRKKHLKPFLMPQPQPKPDRPKPAARKLMIEQEHSTDKFYMVSAENSSEAETFITC